MSMKGRPSGGIDMYNPDIKEQFLEQYTNLGTQDRYRKIFKRTFEFEVKNKKDVMLFNNEEFKEIFYYLESISTSTINLTKSVLNNYIDWTIKEKYRENPINPIKLIKSPQLKNMVSKIAQEFRHLTGIDELRRIVRFCINPQDAICFVLPFYGLKAEEISNLTKDNFDGNIIKIGDRKVEIPEEFMYVIDDAFKQEIYVKLNGAII